MSVLLLCNTIGNAATSLHSTAASSGFDANDYISGPRSTMVRHDTATSAFAGYNCASTAVTHVVLVRGDKFKNSLNSTDVKVQYSTSNTTDSTTVPGSMTMVGPKSQDWVTTIARTSDRFRLLFSAGSSQAYLYSKIYFANSFVFNTEPTISGEYITLQEGTDSNTKPLLGDQRYETELMFTLTWADVTKAKMQSFRALPLFWPLFLYDENGDLWTHKLEHVLIADPWTETRKGPDSYELRITFRRLKHYA